MSDLISRQATIEEIWNVFNNYANDNSKFDEYETEAINMAFKVLQNRIEEQPTAYDVEKVVAELEKQENIAILNAPNTSDIYNSDYQKWMMKSYGFKEAIDIVKAGGIR